MAMTLIVVDSAVSRALAIYGDGDVGGLHRVGGRCGGSGGLGWG